MTAILKFALTAVSLSALAMTSLPTAWAAPARNCHYKLGSAAWPNGRSQAIETLDTQAVSLLAERGYAPATPDVNEAGLVLMVAVRSAHSGWFMGSLASVRMNDVNTRAVVAEGQGTFAVGSQLDLLSAIAQLPVCR
jgi:hypothetical protein